MITRELRSKIFLASTTEEVEVNLNAWLVSKNICPGNLVTSTLYKHGSVYQFVVFYAELIMEV